MHSGTSRARRRPGRIRRPGGPDRPQSAPCSGGCRARSCEALPCGNHALSDTEIDETQAAARGTMGRRAAATARGRWRGWSKPAVLKAVESVGQPDLVVKGVVVVGAARRRGGGGGEIDAMSLAHRSPCGIGGGDLRRRRRRRRGRRRRRRRRHRRRRRRRNGRFRMRRRRRRRRHGRRRILAALAARAGGSTRGFV